MNFPGKNLFFNQKVIALISLVLFSFLLVGALRMVGLYEGLIETGYPNVPYVNSSKKLDKPTTSLETLTLKQRMAKLGN